MPEAARAHETDSLDATDRALLGRLQRHIPLVTRPFAAVGAELGLPEAEAIARTRSLAERGLIRQLSAIFDARSLGCSSSLVAARYAPDQLERGARIIGAHPGVSHSYERDHELNLWYTLAVPPGRSLEAEIALLHRLSGARSTRTLPSLRVFKLGVELDFEDRPMSTQSPLPGEERESRLASFTAPVAERYVRAVLALQDSIPLEARPFEQRAAEHGFTSAEQLLGVAQELLEHRTLRRFSAVLHHRRAGYQANGMVVWMVPPDACERAGAQMAAFASVSHCYQRAVHEDWPYSLFSMIHGRTPEDVQRCIDAIVQETGLTTYRVLYSLREFKKARPQYFTPAWEDWRGAIARAESQTEPARGEPAESAKGGPPCVLPAKACPDSPALNATAIQRNIDRLRVCTWDIASLPREMLEAVREACLRHPGEGMLLSSCQRLEVYSLGPCECEAGIRKQGREALVHLAEVAAGLRSVVLGEEQIVGQVRSALAGAGAELRDIGDLALAAARDLRREASFSSHSGHLLDAGLRVAGVPPTGRILVIGTGHMGRLVARRARAAGFDEVVVAGRVKPEDSWVDEVADAFVALDALARSGPADVVVGCLGSGAAELDCERDLPPIGRLVLDLGTPRNFRPTAGLLTLTIRDLQTGPCVAKRDARQQALQAQLAAKIDRRLAMASADRSSPVGALRQRIEDVRRTEVDRARRLHPDVPPSVLDTLTRSLVNRLFHGVSVELKSSADSSFQDRLLRLFQEQAAEAAATADA